MLACRLATSLARVSHQPHNGPRWAPVVSAMHLPVMVLALLRPADPEAPPMAHGSDRGDPLPILSGGVVPECAWPTAVALYTEQGGRCTGVYVGGRVVLTAAHCLADRPPLSAITIKFGTNVRSPEVVTGAERYGIHPLYCPSRECDGDNFDVAFIQLAKEHPFVALPQVVNDQAVWDETMTPGRTITAVGFGYDDEDTLGIKRRVEATITGLSPLGLEFSAGGDGVDTCQGDSGGPVFVRRETGEYLLAGLTSRGRSCGAGGVYSAVYPALCWLHEQTGADLRAPTCGRCDCIDTAASAAGAAATGEAAGDGRFSIQQRCRCQG